MGLDEGIEDPLLILGGDAWTGFLDLDTQDLFTIKARIGLERLGLPRLDGAGPQHKATPLALPSPSPGKAAANHKRQCGKRDPEPTESRCS